MKRLFYFVVIGLFILSNTYAFAQVALTLGKEQKEQPAQKSVNSASQYAKASGNRTAVAAKSQPAQPAQPQYATLSYSDADVKPSFFGGGPDEFKSWIHKSIMYPKQAKDQGIEGNVILQFIINENGTISNVEVLQGVHSSIDNEAVRIISSSPAWSPGEDNGKIVRVRYTISVDFKINGEVQEPQNNVVAEAPAPTPPPAPQEPVVETNPTQAVVEEGGGKYGKSFTESAFGIDMQFVWVEAGDFIMGGTSEQGGSVEESERPTRRVFLDGYYIAVFEVTQSQWEKVMASTLYQQLAKAGPEGNKNGTNGVGPDYPMYYVNWDEAMEFCRILSYKTGKAYSLPTEAQWEYAARGGKENEGTKFSGGNMVDGVAWYKDNSGLSTHPVGGKNPNALGLYDMSGNVWEWVKDRYGKTYANYDTNNPVGPTKGPERVVRGGSFNSAAERCRVSVRRSNQPASYHHYYGFRVVLLP